MSRLGVGRRRFSVLFGAALLLGACGVPRVSLREGTRRYTANDYFDVLGRWTREARIYTLTGLDTVLAVTATYKAADFRWAFVARYASDLRLAPEERTRLLADQLAQHAQAHEFYVSLQASRRRWADLTRADPIWHVALLDDQGHQVRPVRIQRIERPGAVETEYFPYTNIFRETFIVQFPKTLPDGATPIFGPGRTMRHFILRFSSAQGTGELRWDLR